LFAANTGKKKGNVNFVNAKRGKLTIRLKNDGQTECSQLTNRRRDGDARKNELVV